jgi:hypothetical protein
VTRRTRLTAQLRAVRPSGRRSHLLVAGLVAVLLLSVLAATVPGSNAALTAKITNGTGTAGTAPYFTCAAAHAGASDYYVYPLADNPVTTTAADTSGAARNGTYVGTPAHSTANACVRDTGGSTTFNGSTTWLRTPTSFVNPTAFTIEVWFRTSTAGGYLIGFNNATTGAGTSYDRHLYLTTAGKVTFGVYPSARQVITSAKAYNDGAWHQAAATFGTTGMNLYLDGALVASNTAVTTAANYTGYWRVGYGGLASWTGAATNYFFNGQLGYAVVYNSTLNAATIASHDAAGS